MAKMENRVKLVSVYSVKSASEILYELLKSRAPKENISHREMPSWEEHNKFINSAPYSLWFFVVLETDLKKVRYIEEFKNGAFIGSIYLSRMSEIGVHFFPEHRFRGNEEQAIQRLMLLAGRKKYFMNVSVNNDTLKGLVQEMGFTPLSNTYEFSNARP